MRSVLVLTVSGKDRAGLVEQLADLVAANGGNWEHCRMVHLAGRFVGLLQVSVAGESQQELEVALRSVKGLDVMIAVGETGGSFESEGEYSLVGFDLELLGSDHPGIVRDVFAALAAAQVNVEELNTRTYSAPDSGGILFEAKARLSCAVSADRDMIRVELERIAGDLMVDLSLRD